MKTNYPKFWHSKNIISYLLWPISWCYRLIASALRYFKLKNQVHLNIPIIVVGNISVGGTGKTPLVIWLAQLLKQHGYKPAIISRGYKGKVTNYPYIVTANSDPKSVGDEALLLARHTQCSVMIDPNRVRAVQKILATTDGNIIISDDGLQHYALKRDIEIAVIDGERRFGNGFCLPAGPLREPVDRLKQVDFVVCNGSAKNNEYTMQLISNEFVQVNDPQQKVNKDFFKDKKIHAVAAIGNPQRFFNSLRAMELNFIEHSFPDHYAFQKADFDFGDNAIIVMTEKDAVKCEGFADGRYWYLPVVAQLDANVEKHMLQKLTELSFS